MENLTKGEEELIHDLRTRFYDNIASYPSAKNYIVTICKESEVRKELKNFITEALNSHTTPDYKEEYYRKLEALTERPTTDPQFNEEEENRLLSAQMNGKGLQEPENKRKESEIEENPDEQDSEDGENKEKSKKIISPEKISKLPEKPNENREWIPSQKDIEINKENIISEGRLEKSASITFEKEERPKKGTIHSQPSHQSRNISHGEFIAVVEYSDTLFWNKLSKEIYSFINTFSGKKIKIPTSDSVSCIQLVDTISVHDELGEWGFDPLQGSMKIFLTKADGGKFQGKEVSIPVNYFSNKNNIEPRNSTEFYLKNIDNLNSVQLEEFIDYVIKVNNKKSEYLKDWLKALNKDSVEKVDELLGWVDSDWDHSSLPVNAKKLIQRELNQLKYKTQEKSKKEPSESEKLAMIHRMKRFFIFKTNPADLEKQPYLDEEALKKGFDEIKKEYTGDYLLDQLKTFYQAYAIEKSHSSALILARGMLLHGPPGTGKTTLTDNLPNKIGLTSVSYPLCAAEVNRSLVGQTERLLMDLVTRATRIPYLLCCVAIDEIDGLAPKRDGHSSEHKVDALAVLLSVIGGIKDVPNLIFLASTNRLNQMDDAFKRRMSGQFFVGRPSPSARKTMISKAPKTGFEGDNHMIDSVVTMTCNFSGAALKQFLSYIVTEKKLKNVDRLEYKDVAEIASRTSHQFNIKLGNYSLPELFALQKDKETFFDRSLLKIMKDNRAILYLKTYYMIMDFERVDDSDSEDENEDEEEDSDEDDDSEEEEEHLERKTIMKKIDPIAFFSSYNALEKSTKKLADRGKSKKESKKLEPENEEKGDQGDISKPNNDWQIETRVITPLQFQEMIKNNKEGPKESLIKYIHKRRTQLCKEAENNPKKTFVVLWDDCIQFVRENPKLALLDTMKEYMNESFRYESYPDNMYNIFTLNQTKSANSKDNSAYNAIVEKTKWTDLKATDIKPLKYTGRILIDLSDEDQELRFELEGDEDDPLSFLHCEPLLLDQKVKRTYQVLPKLVEFASTREIDFILLMDQDFLLSSNAFDESKIKENITEKMLEFNCYQKSLLIIDVDSIVGMVSSISDSSMGESNSYNLSDAHLYNIIIHYANSLPRIMENPEREYWVALITKNDKLAKILKGDLKWPLNARELEEKDEQEELDKEVQCVRCKKPYKEKDNDLKSCVYHDGFAVDGEDGRILNVELAKINQLKKTLKYQKESLVNKDAQKKEIKFFYICCTQSLESQGCKEHRHTTEKGKFEIEKEEKKKEYMEKLGNIMKSK